MAESSSPPFLRRKKVDHSREKKKRSYKTLTRDKRITIEALLNAGLKVKDIAKQVGVHFSTIYRELDRGKTTQRNSDWTEREIYSSDLAQERAEKNQKNKGRELKIGNDMKFVSYVEKMVIEEHYSPAAILEKIEKDNIEFDTKICLTTLYNYIKSGIFLNLTMAECPYRKKKGKKQKKEKVQKRKHAGKSIEDRPPEVLTRKEFGHWEMDTVVGPQKSKVSLLVLTERKTRKEIIERLPRHNMKEVVRALDRIERRYTEKLFRSLFKTITVDNGTEFSDYDGMKRSRRNARDRTEVYYCHPYRSCERASNENQNRHIRRWCPKGDSFDDITNKEVKKVESWLNHYPRPMFGYRSSEELFQKELEKLAV